MLKCRVLEMQATKLLSKFDDLIANFLRNADGQSEMDHPNCEVEEKDGESFKSFGL